MEREELENQTEIESQKVSRNAAVDTAAWEAVGCAEGSGLEERERPAGWYVELFAAAAEEEGQSREG
jgi:hypothetical protein